MFLLTVQGKEDTYITGNPSITFFKSMYKHYSNFAAEYVRLEHDGIVKANNTISFRVPNNADLLHKCYLSFLISTDNSSDVYSLFKQVDFEVGGNIIDSISSWGLYYYHERQSTSEQIKTLHKINNMNHENIKNKEILVPLAFFFCKSASSSFPIGSIQKDTIRFVIHLSSNSVLNSDFVSPYLWCQYIYLTPEEAEKFSNTEHVMLIEQNQKSQEVEINSSNQKVKLIFKHLVKEIMWTFIDMTPGSDALFEDGDLSLIGEQHYISSNGTRYDGEQFESAYITVNGTPLFYERSPTFFTDLQYYEHFARIPTKQLFSYHFSLKPLDYQPNGAVNFNVINTANLQFQNVVYPSPSVSTRYLVLFATSYNILRIRNGSALLAFL